MTRNNTGWLRRAERGGEGVCNGGVREGEAGRGCGKKGGTKMVLWVRKRVRKRYQDNGLVSLFETYVRAEWNRKEG